MSTSFQPSRQGWFALWRSKMLLAKHHVGEILRPAGVGGASEPCSGRKQARVKEASPMNVHRPRGQAVEEVRDDYIPASDFFSRDFAEMENELLWPRVWQMACREEDIPKVGDYFTYDI